MKLRTGLLMLALALAPALAVYAAEAAPAAGEHTAAEHAGGEHTANWFVENGGLLKVILVQVFGCVLLFLALKKWVFPFLSKALADRAEGIRATYEKLEAEKKELERLTQAIRQQLAGIEKEAAAKVEAAVRDGNAQKQSILAEAESAAARILAKAKTEIEMERAKAIEEIRQEMVRLALEAAGRLVRQQLTSSKQDELVDRFISEIEKVKA